MVFEVPFSGTRSQRLCAGGRAGRGVAERLVRAAHEPGELLRAPRRGGARGVPLLRAALEGHGRPRNLLGTLREGFNTKSIRVNHPWHLRNV